MLEDEKLHSFTAYRTEIELIKSLKSISYHTVESVDFDDTLKLLHEIIYSLMSEVVSRLPEYEQAQTW